MKEVGKANDGERLRGEATWTGEDGEGDAVEAAAAALTKRRRAKTLNARAPDVGGSREPPPLPRRACPETAPASGR